MIEIASEGRSFGRCNSWPKVSRETFFSAQPLRPMFSGAASGAASALLIIFGSQFLGGPPVLLFRAGRSVSESPDYFEAEQPRAAAAHADGPPPSEPLRSPSPGAPAESPAASPPLRRPPGSEAVASTLAFGAAARLRGKTAPTHRDVATQTSPFGLPAATPASSQSGLSDSPSRVKRTYQHGRRA